MKPGQQIAVAIGAVVIVCAIAAAGLSYSQLQDSSITTATPEASATPTATPTPVPEATNTSVAGGVMDVYGKPLEGLPVTLHIIGFTLDDGQLADTWEISSLTATTGHEGPAKGKYVFDNVAVPTEPTIAFVSTELTRDGVTYKGITSNFTLSAGQAVEDKYIVLVL